MTAQVVLEELGLEYQLEWVKIHIPIADKDPEFLANNPNGRVPTLTTPQGPVYETGAILVYFAEQYPEAGFMPDLDDSARQLYWQWHFYLISSFQPEAIIQDDCDPYVADRTFRDTLIEASMQRLRHVWKVLDDAYAQGPYLLGERYSTCDISFAMQACWPLSQPPEGLSAFPSARRGLRKILERPAVRRVLEAHEALEQANV